MPKLIRYISLLISFLLLGKLSGQKETQFDIRVHHIEYTRTIIESDDGYIWTVGDRKIFRISGGLSYEIPFIEKMGLIAKETNIQGNLYVRGNELFFPIEDKIHAYDYIKETSRVVWQSPDGGLVGSFVRSQDGPAIWIMNARPDHNYVFYSADGFSFGEAIHDIDPFVRGKRFDSEYGLRATDDRLYVHPQYEGLLVIDKTGQKVDLPMSSEHKADTDKFGIIWRLDNLGRLWKLSISGGLLYDESTGSFAEQAVNRTIKNKMLKGEFLKALPTIIPTLLKDSKGRLWLPGGANFLICIDGANNEIYDFQKDVQDGLNAQGSDVRRLLEDRNGNIWLIMNGGLMSISPKENIFQRFEFNNINPENSIYADFKKYANDSIYQEYISATRNAYINAMQLVDNRLYFSHERAIHSLDLESNDERTIPIFDAAIRSFMVQNGELYTSSTNNVSLDLASNKLKNEDEIFYHLDKSERYDENHFLVRSRNVNNTYELYLMDANNWTIDRAILLSYQGKSENVPTGKMIQVLDDGTFLMWSDSFLCQVNIDGEILRKEHVFFHKNGQQINLHNNNYRYISIDEYGDLMISFDQDIIILDLEDWKVKKYISLKGKLNGKVNAIAIPVKDGFWFASNELLAHYNLVNDFITYFGPTDGFVYRHIRVLKMLPKGKIALGTSNGLAIFDPIQALEYKSNQKNSIPLSLLSYSYYSKKQDKTIFSNTTKDFESTISLAHDDRQLELDVQLMDMASAADHLYSYKIEGYSDQWSKSVKNNKINLFGLPPGNYDIKVRAAKSKGVWVQNPLNINIHIKQAWYKQWWAYLSYALLAFGAGYGLYRYRLYQLTKYQNLRTQISSNLHDDVGTLLSSVAMQSEVLGLSAKEEDIERFDKLSRLSREAMGRMRDTVWAIDSRKDNVDSLVDRMNDFLSDIKESGKLKVNFDPQVHKLSTKIPPDVRQNVYLIFKEAVNNAFKYCNGNTLNIELKHSSKNFELTIKDNGQIDPTEIKTSGTGLSNMQMRADRIGGDLEIDSSDGFKITLNVKN